MIGRIFPWASSFHRVCRYISRDQERSVVLDSEGVREHDYRLMARDFETIHSLRELRSKPVFHGMLDFHPDERLDDAKMVEIARKYLKEMGLINTQFVIVKHLDTSHDHMHMVANRIDYKGEHIRLYPELLRNKDVVQQLVKEYQLIPPGKKNLRQTNIEALDASETRKYAIYRSVRECLPGCHDLDELERRLLKHDIDVRYRMDKKTNQRVGISFKYGNEAFKGGNVDKDLTLPMLQKRLLQQLTLTQWESEKLAMRGRLEQEQRQALREKEAEELREQAERQRLEKVQEKECGLTQAPEAERELTQAREKEREQVQRHVPRLRIH